MQTPTCSHANIDLFSRKAPQPKPGHICGHKPRPSVHVLFSGTLLSEVHMGAAWHDGMCAPQAAAVSLFAVGNGLGRLVAGPLSDFTHRRQTCPRPLWLCCATFLMAVAHAVLAMPLGTEGLYLGVFCVGCSFGSVRQRKKDTTPV
jgi:MFS family permease